MPRRIRERGKAIIRGVDERAADGFMSYAIQHRAADGVTFRFRRRMGPGAQEANIPATTEKGEPKRERAK